MLNGAMGTEYDIDCTMRGLGPVVCSIDTMGHARSFRSLWMTPSALNVCLCMDANGRDSL